MSKNIEKRYKNSCQLDISDDKIHDNTSCWIFNTLLLNFLLSKQVSILIYLISLSTLLVISFFIIELFFKMFLLIHYF